MKKLFFHLILLFAGCAIGSPARAAGKHRPPPTVYPVGDRLIRLGWDGVDQTAEKHPPAVWAWINAPESVVEAGKKLLEGDPQDWVVNKAPDYANTGVYGPGPEVVFLNDRQRHFLVCFVQEHQWTRLNDRGGLPALNEVMESAPGRDVFHSNMIDRIHYVEDVANLYRGECRAALSKDFLNRADGARSSPEYWLGTEKRPAELFKLCHDPICTRHGRKVTVKYNVFIFGGGVEEWTLSGVWHQGLVIRKIDVRLIRKLGTFSYGCL